VKHFYKKLGPKETIAQFTRATKVSVYVNLRLSNNVVRLLRLNANFISNSKCVMSFKSKRIRLIPVDNLPSSLLWNLFSLIYCISSFHLRKTVVDYDFIQLISWTFWSGAIEIHVIDWFQWRIYGVDMERCPPPFGRRLFFSACNNAYRKNNGLVASLHASRVQG